MKERTCETCKYSKDCELNIYFTDEMFYTPDICDCWKDKDIEVPEKPGMFHGAETPEGGIII